MNEMLTFLQNHSGVIAIFVSIASAVIATRFVTKIDFDRICAGLRADHEKAITSLDAKFTLTIDKLDKAEDRIARVEHELNHLPSRETVHRMEISLTSLDGKIGQLAEQLKPVASISDRLQEFLLNQAERR